MALLEEFEKQGNWLFRYRGAIPLVVLLIGTIVYLRTKLHPGSFLLKEPYVIYYETFCLLISLSGFIIRVYTVGHTPENTSGRNTSSQLADRLNTDGMYSLVRHPLYLGNFFMWLGPALLTGNFWFIITFCLFYWIYYERIMFAEEQFLREKFGDVYTTWANKIPAFIPALKRRTFVKPLYPFSLKKVLKKEKNGLAAVFIVFSLFDIAGKLIQHRTDFNYFLLTLCIFTSIVYLVLKYLKKNTTILNEKGR